MQQALWAFVLDNDVEMDAGEKSIAIKALAAGATR